MFMESLDPRRLMAARTGQDLAYGDGGSPAFAQGFDSTGILADGAKGATFLAGFIGDRPYVTKLDDAGRVDPRYGDKGYAALPLTGKELYDARTETDTVRSLNVLSLAYDATSGAVYVGTGERTTALGGYTAGVTRLLSSGKVDTAYGVNGTYQYALALPGPASASSSSSDSYDDGPFATADVKAINPLADGSAVVAVDQQSRWRNNTAVTLDRLVLIKLRPDGKRDRTYGDNGYAPLFDGTTGPQVDADGEGIAGQSVHRAFFNDVRTDGRGVTRVILRYEVGTNDTSKAPFLEDYDGDATTGLFEMKARSVSVVGVDNPKAARSWKLFDSTGDAKALTPYAVRYAATDGDAVRAVVSAGDFTNPIEIVYTLRPGERPHRQALDAGLARQFRLVRSANGQYLAYNNNQVARLNADFTPDRTFAVHGIGHNNLYGFVNPYAFADAEGRFLIVGEGVGFIRYV